MKISCGDAKTRIGGHRTSKTYKILLHVTAHKILLDILRNAKLT